MLTRYSGEVDIVAVYRLSLECLCRFAAKGQGKLVVVVVVDDGGGVVVSWLLKFLF